MIPCKPHTFTYPTLNSEDDYQVAELDYATVQLNLRNGGDNSGIHTAHARIVSTKRGRYESAKDVVLRLQDEIKALTDRDCNNTHHYVNIDSGEQNSVRGNGKDIDDGDSIGERSDDSSSKSSCSYGYGYHGKEDNNTQHVDEGSRQSYYDQDSVCGEEVDYHKKVSDADIDEVDKESTSFEDAFF